MFALVAPTGYYIGYTDFIVEENGTRTLLRNDGCNRGVHNRSEGCLYPLPCDPPESCLVRCRFVLCLTRS